MEALLKVAIEGPLTELSVPKLAKRAGVSEPTVYRHFPNREALFDGLEDFMRKSELFLQFPKNPSEIPEHMVGLFAHFDKHEELVRVWLTEGWGADARKRSRKKRLLALKKMLREGLPDLDETDQQRLFAIGQLLASGDAWKSIRDNVGLSGEEAGQAVRWAFRTLLTEAQRMSARRSKTKK